MIGGLNAYLLNSNSIQGLNKKISLSFNSTQPQVSLASGARSMWNQAWQVTVNFFTAGILPLSYALFLGGTFP